MSFKKGIKLFSEDILFKNSLSGFLSALICSFFLLMIFMILIVAAIKHSVDFLVICGALTLMKIIFDDYKRDKKISKLEDTIQEDNIKIKKLSNKEKNIDLNKINQQMRDVHDE